MLVNVPHKLAQPPVVRDLGEIPDPAAFGAYEPLLNRKHGFEHNISLRESEPDLFGIPNGLHGVLQMAFQARLAKTDTLGPITGGRVLAHQGIIPAHGPVFRVMGPHFEAQIRSYPLNDAPAVDIYNVSDTLGTVVYQNGFDLPDYQTDQLCQMSGTLSRHFRRQAQLENALFAQSNHMINYDGYTVHEEQTPRVDTRRTFALILFS